MIVGIMASRLVGAYEIFIAPGTLPIVGSNVLPVYTPASGDFSVAITAGAIPVTGQVVNPHAAIHQSAITSSAVPLTGAVVVPLYGYDETPITASALPIVGATVVPVITAPQPTFTTTNKNAGVALSSGDTEADWTSGSGTRNVYSTAHFVGGTSELKVFAFRIDAAVTLLRIGVATAALSSTSNFIGAGNTVVSYNAVTGEVYSSSTLQATYATATAADIIMIAVATTGTSTGRVLFGKNGTWLFGDPSTITTTGVSASWVSTRALGVSSTGTGSGVALIPYPYTVPSGFTAAGDV